MRTLIIIAGREVRNGMRNRWVVAATFLMTAIALSLAFLGSAPTGTVGASPMAVMVVSLSNLTILLLPLIALLLAYDAICGELDRGTLLLLLSYPVARWQIVLGKFLGHLAILAFATIVGYGAAMAALSGTGVKAGDWMAFAEMIGTSVLLGSAFVALGYLISAAVSDRGTAGFLAVGVWLLFVVIYDMTLLGVLVADKGQILSGNLLDAVLLLNPADIYRLFNLRGTEVSQFAGMAGMAKESGWSAATLLAGLVVWTAVPLAGAAFLLGRRQV